MRTTKFILLIVAIFVLTIVTQIGGIVLLVSITGWKFLKTKIKRPWQRLTAPFALFITLYLVAAFIVVPPIARSYGRMPLSMFEDEGLAPLTVWTCLLNRNYVRRELFNATHDVARKMTARYPGTIVHYLDASFPFMDGFPLPPHLSHNDGRKLDLSFHYIDKNTGTQTNQCPSFIGYGICEGPVKGEEDMPAVCASKGYWQYGYLQRIVPQGNKQLFEFDRERTKSLVYYFSRKTDIAKIFIEPHLKNRLGLTSPKIKFHGCGAVRHDDHVHVQVY